DLNCPNCNETIFEGDKFCGNCGIPLNEEARISQEKMKKSDLNMTPYLKALFTKPSNVLIKPNQYNVFTILTTLVILLLIASALAFIHNDGFYLIFGESLTLYLRAIFIYSAILFAYGIVMLCVAFITSSQTPTWRTLIKSYLSLSIFALVFFTISMLVSIVGISYIPLTLNIFALVTLILGTYYIYKENITKHDKFDSFYVLLIHI